MPELPDVAVYIEALTARIRGQPLLGARLASPFLLRTALPPIAAAKGKRVRELRRLGKRIAIGLGQGVGEDDLWLVLHLMIAGRLHWNEPGAALAGRYALAAFDFPNGALTLTEAGPLPVALSTLDRSSHEEHQVGMPVVGAAVAVLSRRATELRHRQDDDVLHAIAQILFERGEPLAEPSKQRRQPSLFIRVRVPSVRGVDERDL